jgi:hypothetical protein
MDEEQKIRQARVESHPRAQIIYRTPPLPTEGEEFEERFVEVDGIIRKYVRLEDKWWIYILE